VVKGLVGKRGHRGELTDLDVRLRRNPQAIGATDQKHRKSSLFTMPGASYCSDYDYQ
jgi:hypothetical protein